MADPMSNIRFSRVVRTPSSERYAIHDADDDLVGFLDLHYVGTAGVDSIYGSVILLDEFEPEDEEAVIDLVNSEIVESLSPGWTPAELVMDVYVGRRVSTYSDSDDYDDDLGDGMDDEF